MRALYRRPHDGAAGLWAVPRRHAGADFRFRTTEGPPQTRVAEPAGAAPRRWRGAGGLQDSTGRLIDGDHDGQPGGDAVAVLRRRGVTLSALTFTRP
jgi:hypothetical protein